jgi:hypothetical protein
MRYYAWSSYAAVTGLKRCPRWLDRSGLLETYHGSLEEKQVDYTNFVQEGLLRDIDDPIELATAGAILGTPSFVERIRREFTSIATRVTLRHERSQEQRVARWVDLDTVIEAVALNYGVHVNHII